MHSDENKCLFSFRDILIEFIEACENVRDAWKAWKTIIYKWINKMLSDDNEPNNKIISLFNLREMEAAEMVSNWCDIENGNRVCAP